MDKKEATRLRVKRYRDNKKSVTPIPENVTLNVTQYHPILDYLTDPIKRDKLEKICESLGRRKLSNNVYFGCNRYSISFDIVEELLQATMESRKC